MNSIAQFEELLASRGASDYEAFLLPHLRDGMTLLDCGCGPGSMTYGLAKRLRDGKVIGPDISAEFKQAHAHATAREQRNLTFAQGDATALPFYDERFNAVFAHSMVETLDDRGCVA